jgi:hypothetical protein
MNTASIEIARRCKPILFRGPMVNAIRAGRKTQTRRVVSWRNSTVLGHPAKSYWPNLNFELAQTRSQSLINAIAGAGDDPHLAVPWRHPEDTKIPWEDCGKYQTRPIWEVGDRLWVRESFSTYAEHRNQPDDKILYAADFSGFTKAKDRDWDWTPSIFMPRKWCRVLLEVASVRGHRLQDISEADAIAEGLAKVTKDDGRTWKYGIPDRDGLPGNDNDGWHWQDWEVNPIDAFKTLWERGSGKKHPWASNDWVWAITFNPVQEEVSDTH